MEQAIRVADRKDEAHFTYSKLIYQKGGYMPNDAYDGWSLDKALEEAREAEMASTSLPLYRQQQAIILYAQKKYAEASDIYAIITGSELVPGRTVLCAFTLRVAQNDTVGRLALLDSCVAMFSKPYLKEAAPA